MYNDVQHVVLQVFQKDKFLKIPFLQWMDRVVGQIPVNMNQKQKGEYKVNFPAEYFWPRFL